MSLRALSHQLDGLQAQIRGRIEYVRYLLALLPVKFQSESA